MLATFMHGTTPHGAIAIIVLILIVILALTPHHKH